MPRPPRATGQERRRQRAERTAVTQERKETAIRAIASGAAANMTEAAEIAGVSPAMLWQWVAAPGDFSSRCKAALEAAKQSRIDQVESRHFDLATDPEKPNVIAQIHILKHRRAEYADKTVRGHAGPVVNIDKAVIHMADGAIESAKRLETRGDDDDGE